MWQLEPKELPADYRPSVLSLFKAVLLQHYPSEYEMLYGSGPNQKDFTFAIRLPNPAFSDEKLTISHKEVNLRISSASDCLNMLFYNAFQKSLEYSHPLPHGGKMTIKAVRSIQQPKLSCNTAVIKFLSPLVVRQHSRGEADRYYVYEDEAFSACLSQVVERQLGRPVDLKLAPISPRKTVVKAFGRKIRCSLGTYRIWGDPQDLDRLARSGLGSRRGEGFGYFMIVGG